MVNALILVVLLGSVVFAPRLRTTAVQAQTSSALDVVLRFTAAVNAGDVAGMQALLTDDVQFLGGANCFPTA